MFAIACVVDPDCKLGANTKTAEVYYRRSSKLLCFNLLDSTSFEVPQALMLTAEYLHSVNDAEQCLRSVTVGISIARDRWTGLAIRPKGVARLHCHGQVSQPVKVPLWSLNNARITAMPFERPVIISDEVAAQALCPCPGEEIITGTDGPRPEDSPRRWDFFIALCTLNHILGRVLHMNHTASDGAADSVVSHAAFLAESPAEFYEIEQSLSRWCQCLKSHLRPTAPHQAEERTGYVARQADALHAQ